MWPLNAKQIYEIVTNEICPNDLFESIKIHGVATDSRKATSTDLFVAIKGEKFDGHSYLAQCFEKNVPLALVQKESEFLQKLSHDQQKKCIAVDDVTAAFRKLAKYFRSHFSFSVVAIGGSNGKTTTKEMLYSMLCGKNSKVTKTEKSENGFLGMAVTLTQRDHNVDQPPSALVLEIGIDDMGAMAQHAELAQADIALLTALGPEHLEGLKTWDIAAEEELILFSQEKTKRIWQLCDEKILERFLKIKKESPESLKKDFAVISNNQTQKSEFQNLVFKLLSWEIIKLEPQETHVKIEDQEYKIPLPGIHNVTNFATAFAAALACGKSTEHIAQGFATFTPPSMRSHITTFSNGTILYNDAYNASPMSVKSALMSLENKDWENRQKVVVLGDMLDLGTESKHWHTELFHTLKNLKHTHLCLYGSAMYDCYKLLKENEDKLLTENQTCVFWRDASEHPGLFFDQLPKDLSSFIILVKGSRGMQLERFVHAVEEKFK